MAFFPDLDSPQFRTQRRVALLLITLTSVFSFADRQVLSVVLEPIKAEFLLSDTQLGLLSGFAFSAFYATFGLPLAWLADRVSRRRIIAGSLAFFSVMTALCGMATNFLLLFLARIGVGVGEAGTGPSSHSLLADYYPPAQRTSAMSILAVGVMLGAVLGLVVGGVVGQAYGWRAAFFATGLPGIILAAVVIIWLREPQRGHAEGRSASGGPAAGLLDVARYVWNNPAARHLVIAATLYNTGTLGFAQWLPTFYMRVFDMPAGQVGPLLGGMMAVISTAGILAGGLLAQHLENMRPAYGVWMIAAAKIVAVPFSIASLLATSAPTALAFYCVPLFLSLSFIAPANSLMQGLAPLRMRAMAAGLMVFSVALVGGVVGPAVVGVVSDALAPRFGDDSLRFGLLACLVFSPWAAVHFVLCGQKLDAGLSAARGPAIPAAQKLQAG